jgi:hypothetical protein
MNRFSSNRNGSTLSASSSAQDFNRPQRLVEEKTIELEINLNT